MNLLIIYYEIVQKHKQYVRNWTFRPPQQFNNTGVLNLDPLRSVIFVFKDLAAQPRRVTI